MIPAPFDTTAFEPTEWPHCLATVDVSALSRPTKFCDPDGYDVIPIRMVHLVEPKLDNPREFQKTQDVLFCNEEVSVKDVTSSRYNIANEGDEDCSWEVSDDDEEDFDVPESELEKIRVLLRGREEIELDVPNDKPKRKFCKSHRLFRKRALKEKRERAKKEQEEIDAKELEPPKISGKNEYLYYVGAKDCIKNEVKWRYGFQLVQKLNEKENQNPKKNKRTRIKKAKTTSVKLSSSGKSSLTKVERKVLYNEQKRTLKAAWSSMSDDSEEGEQQTAEVP